MSKLQSWMVMSLMIVALVSACGPGGGSSEDEDGSSTMDVGVDGTGGSDTAGGSDTTGGGGDGGETKESYTYTFIDSSNGRGFCGVTTEGKIVCDGSSTFPKPPARDVFVSEGSNFVRVSAAQDHFCGVTESKMVKCWGSNLSGESDDPSGTYEQVAAGTSLTCLLDGSGSVSCKGLDQGGQTMPPDVTATAIEAGGNFFACLLTDGGEANCWGAETYGALETPSSSFTEISVGSYHVCGIAKGDGSVECWGTGTDADAMFDGSKAKQAIPPNGSFDQVEAGKLHTCALDSAGKATCWGMGSKPGEKEDTDVAEFDYDQASPPDKQFDQIAAAADVTCGLLPSGKVECWGRAPEDVTLP